MNIHKTDKKCKSDYLNCANYPISGKTKWQNLNVQIKKYLTISCHIQKTQCYPSYPTTWTILLVWKTSWASWTVLRNWSACWCRRKKNRWSTPKLAKTMLFNVILIGIVFCVGRLHQLELQLWRTVWRSWMVWNMILHVSDFHL